MIKIISALEMELDKEDEKLSNLVLFKCLLNKSSIPGSKKGHYELFNSLTLFSSLSMQIVSYPNSAKQAPVINPT